MHIIEIQEHKEIIQVHSYRPNKHKASITRDTRDTRDNKHMQVITSITSISKWLIRAIGWTLKAVCKLYWAIYYHNPT